MPLKELLLAFALVLAGCSPDATTVTPTCTDGTQDGAETDVDCGGTCGACAPGAKCHGGGDCSTGSCEGGLCKAPTCDDHLKNGEEADVDCGGSCGACGDGRSCKGAGDCASRVCDQGRCAAASCSDGVRNGQETTVDCGGGCACADGDPCASGSDCKSGVCKGGTCQASSCADHQQNGAETGVDCGGGACPACKDGQACKAPSDCASHVCEGMICQAPTCADGVKNQDESDVDCGGSCPSRCADALGCVKDTDCKSAHCKQGKCVPATCFDMILNGTETDVDCGGACPGCADGATCGVGKDCASLVCDPMTFVCLAPACTDHTKNGQETDVDCGGGACPLCVVGKACAQGSDCASGVCKGLVCQAPSCADGVKNQDESGVDCGGACPACANQSTCNTASDCASGACNGGLCGAWSKSFGGGATESIQGVAFDAAHDVFFAATFQGTVDFGFGPASVVQPGGYEAVVGKLTPGGAPLWIKTFGNDGLGYARALAVDANGDVLVAGIYCALSGIVDFGMGALPYGGGDDGFVMKLAGGDGHTLWLRTFGAEGYDQPFSLAIDAAGDVLIAGDTTSAKLNLGGQDLVSFGEADFVAKLSGATGAHVWSLAFAGSLSGQPPWIAVDQAGNAYVTGAIFASNDFGCGPSQQQGSTDGYLVKYDAGGACVWVHRYGDPTTEFSGRAIGVDATGAPLVAFHRGGPTNLGPNDLGNASIALAKLSAANGAHVWSKGFGVNLDTATALVVDASGDVTMTGWFDSANAITFGGASLVGKGSRDVFLAKLRGTDGSHVFSTSFGSPDVEVGEVLAIDPKTRDVVLGGTFNNALNVGAGPLQSLGSDDVFLVSLGTVP